MFFPIIICAAQDDRYDMIAYCCILSGEKGIMLRFRKEIDECLISSPL